MKAICTTTINSPTKALKKFAEIATKDGWLLIIAGDKKTPNNDYIDFCEQYDCAVYLSPHDQELMSKELSDAIGWNCIQRRNFAILLAYQRGAEVMALIDDDNIPFDKWGQNCRVGKKTDVKIFKTDCDVFDPLSPIYPHLWHRGFPIQLLDKRNLRNGGLESRKVLVQADLWDGDPDVDAVCRITLAPQVKDAHTLLPYSSNKIMPFNSQNTFISRDILPTYFLFPHIGRMDDIWAAYITQHKFPNSVVFSKASVWQDRNEHDLSKDLEQELIGYKYSQRVAELCSDARITQPATIIEALKGFVPKETIKAYEIWQKLLA